MIKESTKGHILILIVNLIFAFNIPIAKNVMVGYGLDPYVLTYFRILGAAIVFWLSSLFFKSQEKVTIKDMVIILGASLLGITINQGGFIAGVSMGSPIDASIIITITPILTMLFAALFLKEPITNKKVIGVMMGFVGALLLVVTSANNSSDKETSWFANIVLIISSISYSLYLSIFRNFIKRFSAVTLMKWMFLFASVILTPLVFGRVVEVDYSLLPLEAYLSIGYVILFATFTTYLMIPMAQKRIRPTTLSMYNYLQPIVVTLIAVIMGMDSLGWHKILAAVLVFVGVYFVTKSKSLAQLEQEKKEREV